MPRGRWAVPRVERLVVVRAGAPGSTPTPPCPAHAPAPPAQFGVLVGSVQFPPPPGAPAANGAAPAVESDLASALVKAGLGRTAEWGLNMMTTGSFRLRELGAPAARLAGCALC